MKMKTKRQALFLALFCAASVYFTPGTVPAETRAGTQETVPAENRNGTQETAPEENGVSAPETAVFMDLNEDYSGSFGFFRVENVSYEAYVDVAGIFSTNPGVASVERVETMFKRENSYSDVCLRINGPGETDVIYKAGERFCTTHVTVAPYENPISAVTLTGVNRGEDFSTLTEAYAVPDYGEAAGLELSGDTRGMELFLLAGEEWTIRSVSLNAGSADNPAVSDSYYCSDTDRIINSGVFQFAGLNRSKDGGGMSGSLGIDLYNPANRQTVRVSYLIY